MALDTTELFEYASGGLLPISPTPVIAYSSDGIFELEVAPAGSPTQYRPNYEGWRQVIEAKLTTRSNYRYRPDSYQGIVNALRDAGGSTIERSGGYRATLQSVMELIVDKYGIVGSHVRGQYPITYEGFIECCRDHLNPSEANAPYPPTYEGMIRVIFDAQV